MEAGARVVKTSPYDSHTGNPAPRAADLLKQILVRRREENDKQPRFQQPWFLGVIAGGGELIALHPDGTHKPSWRMARESPLDDPEASSGKLQVAL